MKLIDKITFDDDSACINAALSEKLGIPVVHIKNFHKLNQVIGYAKYINKDGNVYFRGQSEVYSNCLPSLARYSRTNGSFQERIRKLKTFLQKVKEQIPVTKTIDDVFLEPLMQHYGISSRWLDLVDNVWTAIWFGLHDYKSVPSRDRNNRANPYLRDYIHVIKRRRGYLYILLIHFDATLLKKPGYFIGTETKLSNLS